MEEDRVELALRRLVRVVLAKLHHKLVNAAFPRTPFLARYLTLPFEQLRRLPIRPSNRLGRKPKRMLLPPILPLLQQSLSRNIHN